MCDYSLHAVASRPAIVGETLITTTFRGTSTRGFASENDPTVAVCMLPGTELAFAENVRYDSRWIWTKTMNFRVGVFNEVEPDVPEGSSNRPRWYSSESGPPSGFLTRVNTASGNCSQTFRSSAVTVSQPNRNM